MLDPAILHDLQRAMVPPSLPPLAIVREWVPPHTEHQRSVVRAMVAAGSVTMVKHRAEINRQLFRMDGLIRGELSDEDRRIIDAAITDLEKDADEWTRSVERDHARYAKTMARLRKADPQIARIRQEALNTVHGWQRESLDIMLDVALHLRAFRAVHDGQSAIVGSFEDPNDLAAFLEAAIAA